jgi:8-oxo-dGTP pyrophosphatase MutT (NUDIX family)
MYKTRAPKYNWKATKSHGIILIRTKGAVGQEEYLMICRRNTFSYVDYILGKYKENDVDYIGHLIINMTLEERNAIKEMNYLNIWNDLYANSREAEGEFYKQVHNKFNRNLYVFLKLENNNPCFWSSPEWGFPKGRKNERETSINCAMREMEEETGINKNMYELDMSIDPFEEEFIGTNGQKYINIYYVGFVKENCQEHLNLNNKLQMREISKIEWCSSRKATLNIRHHEHSKQLLLKELCKIVEQKKCY